MDGLGAALSPIAQTGDGFMWFGTQSGLLRFDGVRYVLPHDLNSKLPSSIILSLATAQDGSLWIGTENGLSHWVNDKLINYPDVTGYVLGILEDRDGKIWFTTADLTDYSGALCVVLDRGTKCYGKADGISMQYPKLLAQDHDGNLWLSNRAAAVQWKAGLFKTYKIAASKAENLVTGVSAIAPTKDGFLWVGMQEAGAGRGLQQLNQSKWKPFKTPDFDGSTLAVTCLFSDREGTLWVGTESAGLYRIAGSKVDHFGRADGLSSEWVSSIYQDREGNLWIISAEGIDCFHELLVTTFPGPKGPGSNEADGIFSSRDGTLWISRPGPLGGIREGKSFSIKTGTDLPGAQVTSVFEDHKRRLWVGIDRTLSTYENGQFHEIKRASGSSLGLVVGITEDVESNIWAEVIGPPRTLYRLRDLVVKEEFPAPRMPAARKVAADPEGGIWLGLIDGDLARYWKGRIEKFSYPHNRPKVSVQQLTVGSDGEVLASTESGLVAWRHGRQQTLTVRNGLPCDAVYAHVFDSDKGLWLYTSCGVIGITSAELEKWWQDPDIKLITRILDSSDGVHPSHSYFNGAALTPDGRLWFVNGTSVQMIDPAQMHTNRLAPPVWIEEVVADRKSYSVFKDVRLPALTRDLEIDYTGLSFVVPGKVKFRYILEDHDVDWQEPGTRRQAFYTDLHPGKYRFRVVACNNDGIWNEQGATLNFNVAPTWYQTNWFRLSCVAAFLVLMWTLYQLRLHQLAAEFNTKLDARVAERTRIARELHDTLLQSLHGLLFRFQAARNMLPRRPEEAIEALDGAITRTEQAIAESRNAITDLREEPAVKNDIADSLSAMGAELASFHEAERTVAVFSLTVEGQPRPLTPFILDETRRIAHEILTNAFRHAEALRIEVEMRYSRHSVQLRFRDDGKGIDPEILATGGRPGHWGLPGILERAQRIGAKLEFWSEVGAGTEVELIVPAGLAYESSREGARFQFIHRRRTREHRS